MDSWSRKSLAFLDFRISPGTVATYCRWGENLCYVYTDNFLVNQLLKEFWKPIHICQSCYQTAFLSFSYRVAHAPFACQRWGLHHRLVQCATPGWGWCSTGVCSVVVVQCPIRDSYAARGDLVIPRTRRRLGNRAFSVAGPAAWNSLSPDIRTASTLCSFKNLLNTHLFFHSFQLST